MAKPKKTPPPYNVPFTKVRDRRPENGAEIWFIETREFYGSYEFQCGVVEYQWVELDPEDQSMTGTEYFYEKGAPTPPNCVLSIGVGGRYLSDNCLWCPADTVDDLVEKASCQK